MSRGGSAWAAPWALVGITAIIALGSWAHAGELRVAQELPALEVWKAKHEMWLKRGDHIVRTFVISLGRQPSSTKAYRGDGRTPVGNYYVYEKRPRSRFRRFLGINYPSIADADRALLERFIDGSQWADIFFANRRGKMPPASTPLGGRVGIHGHGGRSLVGIDWTAGCIAVSDPDIEYLYKVVPIGTPVSIHD